MLKPGNKKSFISILIISLLLGLTTLIIYQYTKYSQNEERLSRAYNSTNFQSSELYKLFATFSEANYLFNLYAINFNPRDLEEYNLKLDTIKYVIDSLSNLPDIKTTIQANSNLNDTIAEEFLTLKKQVDYLILFSKDSIEKSTMPNPLYYVKTKQLSSAEDVIRRVLADESLKSLNTDTLVKKKENLFNRIFKAKDDTLLHKNHTEVLISKQLDIVLRKNINRLIAESKQINTRNLNELRSTFSKLKNTENQLLLANLSLLTNLKNSIEKLRELELARYTQNKAKDFEIYTQNTKSLRNQLILAVSLMILMVILIIVYQTLALTFERKLIKERNYANEIAEEKTSTLANISHEIRTPLNSLLGLVKLLKEKDDKIDKEIINTLDYDIAVVNSTINDILNLNKIESSTIKVSFNYFNIHNTIEDSIRLHLHQAKLKKLKIINNNQLNSQLLINSNIFRVKQVISNLVSNAIKYTTTGEIIVTSKIKGNSRLIISVQDTGIGIHKDQLEHIFRKYYTVNNTQKTGGFGLGLYISKLLAEQIGGQITVSSTLGKGTTFTFELPIQHTKLEDNPQVNKIQDLPVSLKTVFIDDSKINLFFVEQLLKTKQDVYYFTNGKLALDFIKSNNIEIVITDIKMDDLSGWEILETIKSDAKLNHIQVVACTAEPLLLEVKGSKFAFDATIHKPVKENDLAGVIRKLKKL